MLATPAAGIGKLADALRGARKPVADRALGGALSAHGR
jgi:hypothetical protein